MSTPADAILEAFVDYGLGPDGPGPPPGPDLDPPGSDQVAFDDIVDRLTRTHAWQSVRHATIDEILYPDAATMPFAAIVPRGGIEVDTYDDGTFVRTVNYTLVLVHHDQEALARKALLGSLEAIARNTLDGQCFAGFCIPVFSRLGQAQHPRPAHPEQRVEIPGSFVYLVGGYGARDTGLYYNIN
jgi:hypothetical protein